MVLIEIIARLYSARYNREYHIPFLPLAISIPRITKAISMVSPFSQAYLFYN